MEEIQNSLRPFAKSGSDAASTISNFSATSGVSSMSSSASTGIGSAGSGPAEKDVLLLRQLLSMGYPEVKYNFKILRVS